MAYWSNGEIGDWRRHSCLTLSIIIPVLNEEAVLEGTLHPLKDGPHEIIVVDGGSRDGSIEIARRFTPHVLLAEKNRGLQQHVGALRARGAILLFLHADTQLPTDYCGEICTTLAWPDVVFGAFRLRISGGHPWLRLASHMANLRSRLLRLPYGDQALFMGRSDYFKAGGFKGLPLMEDVDLVKRLNRMGGFRLARGRVLSSGRRWKREGLFHGTFRNWLLLSRFLTGASPQALAKKYPEVR
jgi:rSAM/selenodomain-associated transferase 2